MSLPEMTITMERTCIACDERWEPANPGRLLAHLAKGGTPDIGLCNTHAAELRESLNEAGYRWLDESMKVKA